MAVWIFALFLRNVCRHFPPTAGGVTHLGGLLLAAAEVTAGLYDALLLLSHLAGGLHDLAAALLDAAGITTLVLHDLSSFRCNGLYQAATAAVISLKVQLRLPAPLPPP